MSKAMSDSNGDEDEPDNARTTIEVDREVWRQVRAAAVSDGKNVSVELEDILREYFDMPAQEADSDDE